MDALLDMAGTIYTVNLTRDTLERNISPAGKSDSDRALFLDYPLPCSYRDYCDEYRKRVTPATLGSYRTADTSARLLKRFAPVKNTSRWSTACRRMTALSAGYRKPC